MRSPRVKSWDPLSPGYYHCYSRVVDRRKALGPEERSKFVQVLREYEAFCGVTVLTYCIMPNHFHVLVEVPPKPQVMPSIDVVLERIRPFFSEVRLKNLTTQVAEMRRTNDTTGLEALCRRFWNQMCDLSWFIRLVKQRFTQWFNTRYHRTGTLWECRFHSVLVEGGGSLSLPTIAAYIDLNPVRARLVDDPAKYPWNGFSLWKESTPSIANFLSKLHLKEISDYRLWLYGKGIDTSAQSVTENKSNSESLALLASTQGALQGSRGGIDPDTVRLVFESGGKLSPEQLIRLRVRYFRDGTVLGSRHFVEAYFSAHRHRFGKNRIDGARPLKSTEPNTLFSLRALQKNPIGLPDTPP